MEKQEYSQLELFHKAEEGGVSAQRLSGTALTYIRTYERLVLMMIGIVITGVVCFCVGIEKGKRIALSRINSNLDIAYRNRSTAPGAGADAAQAAPRTGVSPVYAPQGQGNAAAQAAPAGIRQQRVVAPAIQIAGKSVDQKSSGPALKQSVPKAMTLDKPVAVAKLGQPAGSGYTIQVGSYAGRSAVQQEVEILKKQGLLPVVRASGKYTVLCVGNFPDQATARSLLSQLKRKYRDCYIRRL